MTGLGSGDNGEITFLDLLTIAGFLVGIENLNLNATQNDVQAVAQTLAEKTELLLTEIHGHLEEQDKKLKEIMEVIQREDHTETV